MLHLCSKLSEAHGELGLPVRREKEDASCGSLLQEQGIEPAQLLQRLRIEEGPGNRDTAAVGELLGKLGREHP